MELELDSVQILMKSAEILGYKNIRTTRQPPQMNTENNSSLNDIGDSAQ